MPAKLSFVAGLLLLPILVAAETAYVTDNLRLGLHQAADTSDRAFQTLESGQEMEVMSSDRLYANVRLPDGTAGWVKNAYLVDEKPAKLIVAEITTERDSLIAELASTRASFAEPAATIEALQNDAAQFESRLSAAAAEVEELKEQNASYQGLRDKYRGSMPLSWVLAATIVCLIVGFMLGLWWVDRNSRKRHGGFRIQ